MLASPPRHYHLSSVPCFKPRGTVLSQKKLSQKNLEFIFALCVQVRMWTLRLLRWSHMGRWVLQRGAPSANQENRVRGHRRVKETAPQGAPSGVRRWLLS